MNYPMKNAHGQYKIFVDGKWRDSKSTVSHANINPADKDEVFGYTMDCVPDEVDQAMQAADKAFPAWRDISGNVKTKLFLQLAQVLYRNYDGLMRTITCEMGKTLFDARLDLDEAIGVVEVIAPQGISMKGVTYQKNIDGLVMESRPAPRGVAAIITPFNFPVAIPLAQIVSALVTGNTVVWKPSHLLPESSQAIVGAIEEALAWTEACMNLKIPHGILNLVTGDEGAGHAMVQHPIYKALSFTGSKAVGDAVDAVASGLGKKVMKEVGGINCFYVHKDADLPRAAKNFIYGKTITAGQRCTSIQEVLVDEQVYEPFSALALEEAKGIVQGDGGSRELAEADATPGKYSLPPLVSEEQQKRVLGLIDQSVREGAKIRYQKPVAEELSKKGFYAPFTMIENVARGNVLYDTEVFGPVAILTKVKNLAGAIELINSKVGIVGCIDSKDKDATETFIQNVLRTRIDDGRHGTGAFWGTKFGGDRGAGSGNPALDEDMVYGYVLWKTIYRAYSPKV
ncbi:MAG TPA: aldehyde dehydrogenase family protein [Capsulimonadaceae bacterium]|nr:aldehyde dehydrogenase family protein [Capsulimonadaceae bacterium]